MKKVSKLSLGIIVIFFVGAILGYIVSSNYKAKTEIDNITTNTEQNAKEETKEPEVIQKETDEIESFENEKARCKANLNFRESPQKEGKLIYTIPNNTVIDVLAKIRNGWYKVSFNSTLGYVSGEYITMLSEEEKNEMKVEQEYNNTFACVNINTSLNIRERANKNAKMLTSVKERKCIKNNKEDGKWMVLCRRKFS